MPQERSILKMIWTNFVNSLKPRQISGNLMGKDTFGNKYFEIPANPSIGKRKSSRWFQPSVSDRFDQELPAEWEAWLRGRRQDIPSEEEILRNKTIADMKKVNAAELEKEYHPERVAVKEVEREKQTLTSFPKYEEYEVMPGQHQDREDKK